MIKNLLFDLGGVIMDIERMRAVRALEAIGLKDAGTLLGEYSQQGPFGALESGAITVDEWRDTIIGHIGRPVDPDAVDRAFVAFLVGIPAHRLDALRELRRRYGVYMLSNTNPLMWDTEIRRQFQQQGMEREDYFDGIVTSFEAKVMKPDAGIFRYAEQKLGILPGETLFLDDSEANCEAARALGWHAAHVAPGAEFTDIISSYTAKHA